MARGGILRFISSLFGATAESASADPIEPSGFGDNFVTIKSRSFFGPSSRSPDGRFTLVWRDGNDQGTHGGARPSGRGRYILLDGQNIVCEGRMERPNNGAVADNGNFILNDWRFHSQELRGTFYAFQPNGKRILSLRFMANLYNNGISRDGHFAACHTANSGDERDSAVLTVFDLCKGHEIARWRAESGWPTGYEFTEDDQHILLLYPQGSKLTYTLSGEFVDRQKWINESLACGDARAVELVLAEAGEHPPEKLLIRLINSIDTGLSTVRNNDPRSKAYLLRLKGVCFDKGGQLSAALACFDVALGLDPKVGAKRRAEQIRKALAR